MALVNKKIICNIVMIMMFFSVFSMSFADQSYAGSTSSESLVNSVSSPSNGVIKFKITCPANSKVSYTISLTPNNKNASIDKKSGGFKNTSKRAVTKTFSYSAKYFSNKYKITAKATIGNPRFKNYRYDTDSATSKLVTNTKSKISKWTKKEIDKFNKGQKIVKGIYIGTGVLVDIAITKGFGKAIPLMTGVEIATLFGKTKEDYTTKRIQTSPRKGYSWYFSYQKNNSGYTSYLVVYNDKGKFDNKYKLKSYTYNTVTLAIH